MRGIQWMDIPFKQRLAVYDEALRLHNERPLEPIAAVRRIIQERHQLVISYYAVHRWIRGVHNPRNRFNIILGNSGSLCYVIGAVLSDGCCYANPKNPSDRSVILAVRDYDYALAFASSAARIFGKSENYHIAFRQGRHRVKVNSVSLYDLISKGIEAFCDVVYAYPASFIRGFFDGDGDVTTSLSKGRLHVCLRVTNSNKELLLFISDLLLRFFGIISYFRRIQTGPRIDYVEGRKVRFKEATYQLKIDGLEQLALFARRIGFKTERKQEKLTDATRLIKRYSSRGATEHWLQLYEKKNGFWKKRASAPQ